MSPQQRSEALAALLVSRDANPLALSYTAAGFQDTPLHAAVAADDAAMVRLLLRLDARAGGAAEGAFRTEDYVELDGGEEEEVGHFEWPFVGFHLLIMRRSVAAQRSTLSPAACLTV